MTMTKREAMIASARLDLESTEQSITSLCNDIINDVTQIAKAVQDGFSASSHISSASERLAVLLTEREAVAKLIKRLEALS